MEQIVRLILVTFLPAIELRGSIPLGILIYKMNWITVFAICVITNIALGIVFYVLLDTVIKLFRKIRWFENIYQRILIRNQRKVEKIVEKWGELGIALFIGIPLPGTGAISGAIGSYALGLRKRKFFIANLLGVLIAGVLVTAITLIIKLTGTRILEFFIKVPEQV